MLDPLDVRTSDVEFTPVLWPEDCTATAHPLEIRDPDGHVVARGGRPLSFRGGALPVEPGTPCMFGRTVAAAVMAGLPPI